MVQFYLLSVVLNIINGYALVIEDTEEKGSKFDGVRIFLKDSTVRLVLGVLGLIVGIFKLLTVMRGDVQVVGDLLPAIAGLVSGFSLLLEFYRGNSNVTTDTLEKVEKFFVSNRRAVGYATMVIGFLHFLFPSVLLL